MRIMGLDVGSKTVGVAISDPLGFTAQGVEIIKIDEEANPYSFDLFYQYYVCLFGLCGIEHAIFPVVKWIAAVNYKSLLCALFYPASEANFSSKSSLFIFNGNAIDSSVRFAFFYIQRKERN